MFGRRSTPVWQFVVVLTVVALPVSGQNRCSVSATSQPMVFEAATGIAFEPSAAVVLEDPCRALVFSDKSSQLEFFQYDLAGTTLDGLRLVSVVPSTGIIKIEAVAPALPVGGVYVVTSGSNNTHPLVRTDPTLEDRAFLLAPDDTGTWRIREDMSADYGEFMAALRDSIGVRSGVDMTGGSTGWVKIEGLSRLGDEVFLVGVRQYGEAFNKFRNAAMLVLWDRKRSDKPEIVSDPVSLTLRQDPYFRTFGLTSLECVAVARDPECFALVAAEDGPLTSDVRSQLYRFRLADVTASPLLLTLAKAKPICEWDGKAEGLAVVRGGKVLVVFDSDDDRKVPRNNGGFGIVANQDFYWLGSGTVAC